MVLPLPASLSPSKISSFKDCGLAFRLSAIEHLPEPPSAAAVKGTLVHRVLQMLMWEEPPERSLAVALDRLGVAAEEILSDPQNAPLQLAGEERADFLADAETLVRRYFTLEDPTTVRVIGTELRLSVEIGSLTLRGIIDRLELDEDGELVVTDYKTGRAPSTQVEQARLGGVHFYAFLCEAVLGRRPVRVQLLHLREPMTITACPSDKSIRALQRQTEAIWSAVELACEREDFRPQAGPAVLVVRIPLLLSGGRRRPGEPSGPLMSRWLPPTINLPEGGRMTAFDDGADAAFERVLRGRRGVDVAMYAGSALGDHGILWLGIAVIKASRRRPGWQRALVRSAAGLGLESALVNGPVKWVFRRNRPVHEGPRPLHLRQPRTSSFPSGHATAGFFAAALLGEDDPLRPLYYGLAVVVAASRVHVKIHHASDVVGGAIIGAALGVAVRRAVPLHPPGEGPQDQHGNAPEESSGPGRC